MLSALALPAQAKEDADLRAFRELDENGDGYISREEFTLHKEALLYALDKNHDLKIERNETKLPPEVFKKYAGPDGTIDAATILTLPEAQFNAFDKNDDGKISLEEFRQHLAELRSGEAANER
ncbi:MAG TPA: EF-hand domain-containing protein [Magnetospirillum sp.]|nr:EF-hand domain-containing protein [Magnetospirillum sp.]